MVRILDNGKGVKQLIFSETWDYKIGEDMKQDKFYKEVALLKEKIGRWKIAINELCLGDYILGYYFDNDSQLWKVYINYERGRHRVRLETKSEEEALSELYDMISAKVEAIAYCEKKSVKSSGVMSSEK